MSEYEIEPIPGLPGIPPPGERILWQGSPEWRALARTAFHTRLIAGYFALLLGWAILAAASNGAGDLTGVVTTAVLGVIVIVLLHLLAWGSARTTIYTLTNRRIVLRFGVALQKAVNLPLKQIAAADAKPVGTGHADIAFRTLERFPLGWLQMWPHVRPWAVGRPQPMLRGVPAGVAVTIANALAQADPALAQADPALALSDPAMVRPAAAPIRVASALEAAA